MRKTSFRGFLMLFVSFAIVFSPTVGAESAEKTFKFPNGISFSYPGEYEASECDMGDLGYGVALMNMSDDYRTMTFSVVITDNPFAGLDLDQDLALRQELAETLAPNYPQPQQVSQSKIKVAGREAILTESTHEDAFIRLVEIRFGNEVVAVNSMALEKSKVNRCRAIAEKIERSLKF